MGCLCFGQREPGWGQEILAEEGGSSAGMQSESWFDLTESFSVPSHFPNPLPRPTFSNPPLPLPQTFWWVVCGWDVVVDGGGREKIDGSALKLCNHLSDLQSF